MTGIERLRDLAWARTVDNGSSKTLHAELISIADQIEREQSCDRDTAENVRLVVGRVIDDMERHCLGHEGMDDSPVARWARELRDIVCQNGGGSTDKAGCPSPMTDEDRAAAAWVREHFGLDHVMQEWRSRVPYDCYERKRQRLLGHIAECETALGRRNRRIEELGHRVSDLTRENAELRRRAMPDGCEWPRYTDGSLVEIGDEFECWCGEAHKVDSVTIMYGRSVLNGSNRHSFIVSDGPFTAHGKRVKRPAVLAADGEPLEVGQTAWHEDGTELKVLGFGDEEDSETIVRVEYVSGPTRWGEVRSLSLTHTKPEPSDSWERLKSDIYKEIEMQPTLRTTKLGIELFVSEVVRRCRALAERERGE